MLKSYVRTPSTTVMPRSIEHAADVLLNGGADVAEDADQAHRRAGDALRADVDGEQTAERSHQTGQPDAEQNHADDERGQRLRTEEDQPQPGELADREQQVDRRPPRIEQLVGDEAVRDRAGDAGESC